MQKHVNLVDLVKSFPTNIFLQNFASIQKRTNPIKFAHLAEKSENGSISNLSTKQLTVGARAAEGLPGWRQVAKLPVRIRVRKAAVVSRTAAPAEVHARLSAGAAEAERLRWRRVAIHIRVRVAAIVAEAPAVLVIHAWFAVVPSGTIRSFHAKPALFD